jgi:hypothetical protein
MNTTEELEKIKTYTRQFHLDRIGELRQQVKDGTPFVFLGALAVLKGSTKLIAHTGTSSPTSAIQAWFASENRLYSFSQIGNLPEALSSGLTTKGSQICLTHVEEDHMTFRDGKLVISAGKFLDDVESIIKKQFDRSDLKVVINNLMDSPTLYVQPQDRPAGTCGIVVPSSAVMPLLDASTSKVIPDYFSTQA